MTHTSLTDTPQVPATDTASTAPKIALITGGSRGLGRDAALALAARGWRLVLTYHRQAEAAAEVVAKAQALGVQAVALPLDTSACDTFPRFVDDLKAQLQQTWHRTRLDALVNNAGFGVHASYDTTTEADFDALMRVHLKGPFFLTQALLPTLSDGGRILNVSSGLARFSVPGYAAYAAMKGAVEVWTRYLAKELGPRGIRANVLAPGAIATDFGGGAVRDNASLNAALAAQTALGRVGQPEDIGQAVALLLSSESSWINGQRVEASGGMFL